MIGAKGAQRCRAAKSLAYPTLSSTSCWQAPTQDGFRSERAARRFEEGPGREGSQR